MQRAHILSMQAELHEFVKQTQIRLKAVRKLINHTRQASPQNIVGSGDSLPPHVPPHTGTSIVNTAQILCPVVLEIARPSLQDAAELNSAPTATERLESIKRRLAEQIQKN